MVRNLDELHEAMGVMYWLVALWAGIVAVWAAYDDHAQIDEGQTIHHPTQWGVRAVIVGIPAWAVGGYWYALALAFAFSALFRLVLNLLRGLSPLYIAPWSNVYDRAWMAIASGAWPSIADCNNMREWYFRVNHRFIHRIGVVAYAGEVVIATILIIASCPR